MSPEELQPASHVILMCQPEVVGSPGEEDPPLTAAGLAAARGAASEMYGAGHHPGPLLVSDTLAGRQTAAIIAETVHLDQAEIRLSSSLHGATTDMLEVELRALARQYTLVTLVAHNPGVSELARILARNPAVPTLQPAQWRYLPWPPPY